MEPNKQKLDQWLDQALADYGHAEPRLGLEIRVLANLAAGKTSATRRTLWPWAFASIAVSLTVVVAFWSWLSMQNPRTPTKLANNKTALSQKPAVSTESAVKVSAPQPVKNRKPRQLAKATEPEKAPRLNQFPSVRELSPQEQLLLRYAQEFPKQALEIAQAQAAAKQARINAELEAE